MKFRLVSSDGETMMVGENFCKMSTLARNMKFIADGQENHDESDGREPLEVPVDTRAVNLREICKFYEYHMDRIDDKLFMEPFVHAIHEYGSVIRLNEYEKVLSRKFNNVDDLIDLAWAATYVGMDPLIFSCVKILITIRPIQQNPSGEELSKETMDSIISDCYKSFVNLYNEAQNGKPNTNLYNGVSSE